MTKTQELWVRTDSDPRLPPQWVTTALPFASCIPQTDAVTSTCPSPVLASRLSVWPEWPWQGLRLSHVLGQATAAGEQVARVPRPASTGQEQQLPRGHWGQTRGRADPFWSRC